jgi:hypothetical protein
MVQKLVVRKLRSFGNTVTVDRVRSSSRPLSEAMLFPSQPLSSRHACQKQNQAEKAAKCL